MEVSLNTNRPSRHEKQQARLSIPTKNIVPVKQEIEPDKSIPILESAVPETAVSEVLRIEQLNCLYPTPFLETDLKDLFPPSEYDSKVDSLKILRQKGSFYLSFPEKIHLYDPDDTVKMPPVEECIGIIFTLSDFPIAFDADFFSRFPDDTSYESILKVLDASYSPMYVISKDGIYQTNSTQVEQTYKTMFAKK